MALKAMVTDINTVPEAQRPLYIKSGDTFILDVDGKDVTQGISEYRNNNIALKQKTETLEAQMEKFKGIDPEKYAQAVEALKKLGDDEEGKMLKDGKLEEVLKRRTKAMQDDFATQTSTLKQENKQLAVQVGTYKQKLGSLIVDSAVTKAISEVGTIRQGALDDVLNRARQTWVINDNAEMVPSDGKGGKAYGKGGDILTLEEWTTGLLTSAPHLFEAGQGGGAGGGQKKTTAQQQDGKGPKVIKDGDHKAFGQNLAEIASGKAVVQDAE